jgi:aromatic ring-opening dioxygenase catalytic subunit (LigB family)
MTQPAIYIPHGGGPWPFVDLPFGPKEMWAGLENYLRHLVVTLPEKPKAILCVSAHWEEAEPTVMSGEAPPLLFDYYGFPEEAYRLTWPAPGDPTLARRVLSLLTEAGLSGREDPKRGFDHGTFVPLKLAAPEANIKTVQLSLIRGLSPKAHFELGKALAPLRNEGVVLIGSGMSYHNMRGFGSRAAHEPSRLFDSWLAHAVSQAPKDREEMLLDWESAPAARACHPREEHLLPLHVMAGAGALDRATVPFRGPLMGAAVSAVQFG